MTGKEFVEFQHNLFDECKFLVDTKGIEYARSGDNRFANFERGAKRNRRLTRLDVAQVYLGKHLDSIDSYVEHGRTFSNEPIRGRVVDAINYLCFILAMIEDNSVTFTVGDYTEIPTRDEHFEG